jgi:hypothetical protein
MLRLAYALALGYVGLCAWAVSGRARPAGEDAPPATEGAGVARAGRPPSGPAAWFARVRPRCNAVEVSLAMASTPPPAGDQGAAYQAGCYALAGRIDDARRVIDGLDASARAGAAGIVFGIVHPVADAGDDRSAGPMMRLVLEYWPDNFMAVYHAGMSEAAVGDHARARAHLRRFLELYRTDDGWTRNAREVLARPEMQ